jgi:hypothetical protein
MQVVRPMSFGDQNCVVLGTRGKNNWEQVITCGEGIEPDSFVHVVKSKRGKAKIIKSKNKSGWLVRFETSYNMFLIDSESLDKHRIVAIGKSNHGKIKEVLLSIPDKTTIFVFNDDVNTKLYFGNANNDIIDFDLLPDYVPEFNIDMVEVAL